MDDNSKAERRAARLARRSANQAEFDARDIRNLGKNLELLRVKLFTIQEALIRSNIIDLGELGGPLSSISPIEIRRAPDADVTLIVFAGMAMRLSMPTAEFFATISQAEKPMNIIFVKDFWQCWYLRGLLGLSGDVGETADYLKGLVEPGQKLVTLGTSAGGYAAILYGVILNAERCISFGPQTLLDEKVFKRFRSTDSRITDFNSLDIYMDLQKLPPLREYGGTVEIHFAMENETDRLAAERLSEFPSVRLTAHQGESHGIAKSLRDSGVLSEIIDSI